MLQRALAVLAFSLFLATPALSAQCGGDFNVFLRQMAREAEAAGISPGVVNSAFAGVTLDREVIAFDHRQRGTFRKSFEDYARTRVTAGRINGAKKRLKSHAALLSRIERQSGVPPQVIVAIWGLETDFGTADMGKRPVVKTLATIVQMTMTLVPTFTFS